MKFLETKHERNSAKITALIMLILVLLVFVVGPDYLDPPTEYGVAVNFGATDYGTGNVQPNKPIKLEPKEINKPTEETPTESKPEEAIVDKVEDVVTQESEESIKIRKQKEAKAKAKAEAERIEREKREAEEKKRKEQEEKKKKLDALMGGIGKSDGETAGSEGDDSQVADKGQPDGNPYANSYYGGPGSGSGGIGYGLNGRGEPTKSKVIPKCNEEGKVVVEVHVNQQGKVTKAIPGRKGTTGALCLFDAAKKTALTYKWPQDNKAPTRQIGFVIVNFSISQ